MCPSNGKDNGTASQHEIGNDQHENEDDNEDDNGTLGSFGSLGDDFSDLSVNSAKHDDDDGMTPLARRRASKQNKNENSNENTNGQKPRRNHGRSKISTGTKTYMAMYPEQSADGILRLGNLVPEFSAETTQGPMKSFHAWKKGKWAVLFSHPSDFTPVCTTEIAAMAVIYPQLKELDCLLIGLSVDPVDAHHEWMKDIVAHYQVDDDTTNNNNHNNDLDTTFPIIADPEHAVAKLYGMTDITNPGNLTIRSVFIIDPDHKLMLNMSYPASVGRSSAEIIRCVQSLQLSYQRSVATPCDWPNNHSRVKLDDGTISKEWKGSVFLLPTVTVEQALLNYPGFHTCQVPSQKKYLRLVKADHVGGVVSTESNAHSININNDNSNYNHRTEKKTAKSNGNRKGNRNGDDKHKSILSGKGQIQIKTTGKNKTAGGETTDDRFIFM